MHIAEPIIIYVDENDGNYKRGSAHRRASQVWEQREMRGRVTISLSVLKSMTPFLSGAAHSRPKKRNNETEIAKKRLITPVTETEKILCLVNVSSNYLFH